MLAHLPITTLAQMAQQFRTQVVDQAQGVQHLQLAQQTLREPIVLTDHQTLLQQISRTYQLLRVQFQSCTSTLGIQVL